MQTHGGNIWHWAQKGNCKPEDITDFSANINLLGPPTWLRQVLQRHTSLLSAYPDIEYASLYKQVSTTYNISIDNILVGNGASELFHLFLQVLHISRAIIPVPSYSDYERLASNFGLECEFLQLDESSDFSIDFTSLAKSLRGNEVVFLGNPNNPTGILLDYNQLVSFIRENSQTWFIIDESFAGLVSTFRSLIPLKLPNVIVIQSLTKFYAIPGLRLGIGFGPISLIEQAKKRQPTWSMNTFAQIVGERCLQDLEYQKQTITENTREREWLFSELNKLHDLKVIPSTTNFFLSKIGSKSYTAETLNETLFHQYKILIRDCSNFKGLNEQYIRLAVKTRKENESLIEALDIILNSNQKNPSRSSSKQTPALMLQGTGSGVGKSLITAAFCRILSNEGFNVSPFKAQNMSLNSFVTANGEEISRSIALQSQAAGKEVDVRMNPLLLKPSSDTGSQAIVMGKPVGSWHSRDFLSQKEYIRKQIIEAYDSIKSENDLMVLEGAGSPGEINLKKTDLVNMRMARHAQANVLLIGDIDKGGVFASFIGHMEVMEEWERKLVRGFLINKFRGDASLLQPAIEQTQDHTGKPTMGIIPYVHGLNLPEEDGMIYSKSTNSFETSPIKIGIIAYPHMSNFTDFDAFYLEDDVGIQFAQSVDQLQKANIIILPGSKNINRDINWLEKSGISQWLTQHVQGKNLIGICGGFQMLGKSIYDEYSIESEIKVTNGLGVLDIETQLGEQKKTVRTTTKHLQSQTSITGYEIHHGVTNIQSGNPLFEDQIELGISHDLNNTWGTYLHGIFDNDDFRFWWLNQVRKSLGLPQQKLKTIYNIEPFIDQLAQTVRQNIDFDFILEMLKV